MLLQACRHRMWGMNRAPFSCCQLAGVHLGSVADDEVAIRVHRHAQWLPRKPGDMLQPARTRLVPAVGLLATMRSPAASRALQRRQAAARGGSDSGGRRERRRRQRRRRCTCLADAPRSAAAGRWWRMPGRRCHQAAPQAFLHVWHQALQSAAAGRAHKLVACRPRDR